MTNTWKLLLMDMKIIFRDRSLLMILAVPFIIMAMLRTGVPLLLSRFPVVAAYYPLIVCFLCIAVVLIPAFIMAMIFIEEKEQHVWEVMKVMPYSLLQFIQQRVLVVTVWGWLFCMLLLWIAAPLQLDIYRMLLLALLVSVVAPVIVLAVITYTSNKVETLTAIKLANVAFMIPLAGFFIKSPLAHSFGVIPVYWIYQAFYNIHHESFYVYYAIALTSHIALLVLCFNLLLRRSQIKTR